MNANNIDYQVIIIGGGPAGIATSLSLSARGISNCIIEAQHSPSNKSGEAIPPNAKPLLKKMGIFHLVENPRHIPYYGNKSCWGTEELVQEEFIKSVYGHGYLLSRRYFECQLWEHTEMYGGTLLSGSKCKKVIQTLDGIEVKIDNGKESRILKSSYIVDASGRKSSVCNQLGITKHTVDTQFAIACTGYTSKPLGHQIYIETTEKGWWYVAPQGKNEVISLFFTLKELLPSKDRMKCFLSDTLASSLHTSQLLKNVHFDDNSIHIMPTGTSRLTIPYGKGWVAVGDAAFSYDPLSSYGITSALASGYYAGHAIASELDNTPNAMQAYHYIMEEAYQAYVEKLITQYELEKRWEGSIYWTHRLRGTYA